MAKWNQKDTHGISIGGQFYPADESGTVTVPDNVGDLAQYGFTPVRDTEAEAKARAEAVELQAQADAVAQAEAERVAAEVAAQAQADADKAAEAEKVTKKSGK
jgi:regulator of protease activity HflC (stomatin/prohibitin superfamily)